MIRAVIFDFDGIILDTETPWFEAYREAFREEGGELPLEEWSKGIGTTYPAFDPYAYLAGQLGRPVERIKIEARAAEIYKQLVKGLAVLPGVESYLQQASRLGLRIGLSSSSDRQWVESYLKQYGLFNYFEAISTRDDVKEVKPKPDLYLRTMKLLDVAGEEAIAFEDSLNGLRAALAAGLHTVVIPNKVTGHMAFEGYRYRLTTMADMPLEQLLQIIVSSI